MKFTIVKEYWEQGTRPGKMKVNLVRNASVIEADSLEAAIDILQRRAAHAERISYSAVQFHSAHLFQGDVSEDPNPFAFTGKDGRVYRSKRWTVENPEVVQAHDRFVRGGERPGFWANLSPQQQHAVALADRLSPEVANWVAGAFRADNMPI